MSNVEERAIQATDIDAIEAKAYAVNLGYWVDPYIKYFSSESKSKAPEINRGYFARTKAIENITKEFIKHNAGAQIVSIGAGSDTLHFRLIDQGVSAHKFIELDLEENVSRKIGQMYQRKAFRDKLTFIAPSKSCPSIVQDPYYLFSSDLRSNPLDLINLWRDVAHINFNNPTLFIAECVLVYIRPDVVDHFLVTLTSHFPRSAFLSYDPINMNDAFGRVMIQNLRMRNIELRGLARCGGTEAVTERYKKAAFTGVAVWSISEVYAAFPSKTLRRIEALEMLDDPEMMKQLFDHYCLVLATTQGGLFVASDIESLLSAVL